MCVGNACVLIAALSGFVADVPPPLKARLASTNAVDGTFVQTKTAADGAKYVTRGTYEIRPGTSFTWRTTDPFETCFYATPTNYVYSNEDESVSRRISDLPGHSRFDGFIRGDFSAFFKAFDALYAEEGGRFYVRAKPKVAELRRHLRRVDVEGVATNWTLRAELVDGTSFSFEVRDLPPGQCAAKPPKEKSE